MRRAVPIAVLVLSAAITAWLLRPEAPAKPRLALPALPREEPAEHAYSTGALAGLVVYLSPGHGAHLVRSIHAPHPPLEFGLQRAVSHGVREDLFTWRVADTLAARLEAEGAVVLSLRERDPFPIDSLADDGSLDVQIDGPVGFESAIDGVEQATILPPGGEARFRLVAPGPGPLHLTARWTARPDRDPAAVYIVHAPGVVARRVTVDQRAHGDQWWPLGWVDVVDGDTVTVDLVGSGEGTVSVDRVRLGGGTQQRPNPWSPKQPFEFERWQGSAWEYLVPSQSPPEMWGVPHTPERVSDARIRSRWTTWAHPPDEEAIYLSIHTNAWGYQRGTATFWGVESQPPTPSWPEAAALTRLVHERAVAVGKRWSPRWRDLYAQAGDYSEISPRWNSVRAATLIEVGYHSNAHDAAVMREQDFREELAAALVEAVVAYRTQTVLQLRNSSSPSVDSSRP